MAAEPRTPTESDLRTADADRGPRASDPRAQRRRASRTLWSACEALLGADHPRALGRALDRLASAFDCQAVALHALGPSGTLEPWCARGVWRGRPGDLRACITVPLHRGEEQVGILALRLAPGQRWSLSQEAMMRTAAGALGAALGARIELRRLRHQPGRDPVTGLPDARAFHAELSSELDRARRHGVPLGVAMVDLDHFGALNARFGRDTGDRVLMEVALVLRLSLRESDTLARLGADCFGVLLPEADLGPAWRCCERLRAALEDHRFARAGRLTASFGVASSPRSGLESLELLERADRALAVAKKGGRRRVSAAEGAGAH